MEGGGGRQSVTGDTHILIKKVIVIQKVSVGLDNAKRDVIFERCLHNFQLLVHNNPKKFPKNFNKVCHRKIFFSP